MQSVRFNCKTLLHLILQPEEKHLGPLNDLNANDNGYKALDSLGLVDPLFAPCGARLPRRPEFSCRESRVWPRRQSAG